MYQLIDVPDPTPAEECRQLRSAYWTCKNLSMPVLPILIRLHEIEDGY
jgi:hypothetical protein